MNYNASIKQYINDETYGQIGGEKKIKLKIKY